MAKNALLTAITVADQVAAMAENALSGLELSIEHWPPEYSAIVWDAVSDIASRRAAASRASVSTPGESK